MMRFLIQAISMCTLMLGLAPSSVFAMGGTSIVATKGQQVSALPGWPKGVEDLVNDPSRTAGWNSWFSEWPNDVNQYGFEIATTDDLNRLIRKLAAIASPIRQIHLSPLKEPEGLGWVTRLPKDNKIAAIFSIGDQSRIDAWYKHVRKPFGKMEFIAAPVAVPPTLTVFVQNKAIDLDAIKIPKEITVSVGYVPTVFHRANTKAEKERDAKETKENATGSNPPKTALDEASQPALDRINAFLKKHNDGQNKD